MTPATIALRPAGPADLDSLWRMLAVAAYEDSVAAARAIPVVAMHLQGWQRAGDFGVIAARRGVVLGAAWARQFTPEEQPAFHVDARTPELSIGVEAAERGKGIGTALLRALIAEARHREVGLCLNVRTVNPALALYQRLGFRCVPGSELRNRTGGISVGMVLA